MNKRQFIFVIFLLLVLFLPAVYFSINTPFALIDDLGDWEHIKIFDTFKENNFFNISGRYRPTWVLSNAIFWKTFGVNYHLHHFFRIVLKLIPIWYVFNTFKLLYKTKASYLLTVVFIVFYVFIPNAPDARLAPQEVLVNLFLSMTIFYSIKVYIIGFNLKNILYLLLTFILLSGSKEIVIPFLVIIIMYLLLLIKNNKKYFYIIPFFIVTIFNVYIFLKIVSKKSYGVVKAPLIDIMQDNVNYINKYVLSYDNLLLFYITISIVVIFYIVKFISLYKSKYNGSDKSTFSIFIYSKNNILVLLITALFIGGYAISCLFWAPSLRYYYPLSFLWAILMAMASYELSDGYSLLLSNKIKYNFILTVCVVFIYSNYYNFLNQYYKQYQIRNREKDVLDKIQVEIDRGYTIKYDKSSEMESKITRYFNDFLPYFYEENNYRGKVNKENLDSGTVLLSRIDPQTKYRLSKKYNDSTILVDDLKKSGLMEFFHKIFPIHRPIWKDFGLADYYYILINTNEINKNFENEFYDDIIIKVDGANGKTEYAESKISVPTDIKAGDFYIIELEYKTIGVATPYVIIYGTPYNKNKILLHEKIPTSNKLKKEILVLRVKDFNIENPLLIFRNWSSQGLFIINKFKIYKLK